EGRALTYRELDERANQLAHALRRRGVGPEALVGVCMQRSLELIVALYGVLKAGGAYVPIDPEYPKDRLAFVLQDAKPRVILTQPHLASILADHDGGSAPKPPLRAAHGADVVALGEDWGAIDAEPRGRPARDGLTLESLAYVIYTSGST